MLTHGGHNSQLSTLYCHTKNRKLFWSNRLVRKWNCLTQNVASSSTTSLFKRKLQHVNFNGGGGGGGGVGGGIVFINLSSPLYVYMLCCTTNKQ